MDRQLDGIFAKKILIALAKKLSFDSVRRVNFNHIYGLKLVSKRGAAWLCARPIGDSAVQCQWSVKSSNSGKWAAILNGLVGYEVTGTVGLCSKAPIVEVNSIEELVISLMLEGHLKNI